MGPYFLNAALVKTLILAVSGEQMNNYSQLLRALPFLFLLVSFSSRIEAQQTNEGTKEKAEKEIQSTQNPPASSPQGDTKKARGKDVVVTVEEEAPIVSSRGSVATKLSAPILDTPASISVVSHSLFKSQDSVTLTDAMRNVPGINIQSNFGVHDFFFIRGFDSLATGMVLTDGAAEPEATFYNLYNIDQVEVLRGPGTFLYGGNPMSGAINLTRKQPRFSPFMQASGTMGSFGTFRGQFDFNLGEADSPVAFRINAMGQDVRGYRNDQENHQVAINPALTWRVSDKTQVTFNFEYVSNEYSPDAGLPLLGDQIAPVNRQTSFGSPFDHSEQELVRFRFDWHRQVSDQIELRNKFYYTELDWQTSGTLLVGVFPNATGSLEVQRVLNLLDDGQRFFGNQFEGIFRFNTGSVRHELLTGIEVARLGDDFTLDVAFLPGLDLFNPVETARKPLFLLPNQSLAGDQRSIIVAPYIVDRIQLSEQVHVFLGGRLDHLNFEDEKTGVRKDENEFSPMAGLVVKPHSQVSVYFSGGTSFAPPSSLVRGFQDSEQGSQLEFGIKNDLLDGRLGFNAALYHVERENVAIPDATGVTRQLGMQESDGFELESVFQVTPGWYTFAGYSFNDSELTRFAEIGLVAFPPPTFGPIDRSGNTPPFAPRHIFNLWTSKDFSNGIGVGGGARYVSGQFIAPDNAFKLNDYVTLDAVISYRVENWRLSFNFKNLTDKNYETRGFGASSVIPADAFGVFGTIQYTR